MFGYFGVFVTTTMILLSLHRFLQGLWPVSLGCILSD